ncbi:DUF4844 domain-containing protein [Hymenobacter sp. BT770]|uniref:DUF4844 domain-containing protein n=1 Tax=Hymenobacter sp. BT770 TaxID=2886942 RepID=UPI001D112D76|nr:DUF4844 domain-containing protein [Hymenobacter sp. BT770]MCC3153721.1 DUF4844 domain-containing protein [Hymenobacter sp. BT770]MDO3413685.1 DUF4844 domain-containing protein [Hymenobacter sp. BT770]
MRKLLFILILSATFAGHAQTLTPLAVPTRAAAKLEKVLKKTQDGLVTDKRPASLPVEARPALNRILVQSTTEFLAITSNNPTKEAYLQTLDSGLNQLNPLVKKVEERQDLAVYYQALLDIVGLKSSEGLLTAFVEKKPTSAKR